MIDMSLDIVEEYYELARALPSPALIDSCAKVFILNLVQTDN